MTNLERSLLRARILMLKADMQLAAMLAFELMCQVRHQRERREP